MYVSLSGVRILAGSSERGAVMGDRAELRAWRAPTCSQQADAGITRAASPRRAGSLWKLTVTPQGPREPCPSCFPAPGYSPCQAEPLLASCLSLPRPINYVRFPPNPLTACLFLKALWVSRSPPSPRLGDRSILARVSLCSGTMLRGCFFIWKYQQDPALLLAGWAGDVGKAPDRSRAATAHRPAGG